MYLINDKTIKQTHKYNGSNFKFIRYKKKKKETYEHVFDNLLFHS